MKLNFPTFVVLVWLSGTVGAESPNRDELDFFEREVRPVLAQRCLKCHGAQQQKGDLRLDSRDGMLAGGESGPALEPGKPNESRIVAAIRREALEMPPDGKLPDAEIAVLVRWVELGAPWPDTAAQIRPDAADFSEEDRNYWAFLPVRKTDPPAVADAGWCRTDVDRFILERLTREGLQPSPVAEPVALVRRVYFDLIGLPPTPAEVEAFLQDTSPQAWQKLVDRLLDSPRYGEKWARHWLDLVRYAESDGYKADGYRPNAWLYRDYVIRALNQDKPYNRFVVEQLAGDEIAPHDPDSLAATSYLRHWIYEYNQRDVRTQWQTILNDITDVTADVFLGLGYGCARCHDHKFDPILQRDYYRLQAFFTPLLPRDDIPYGTPEELASHTQQQRVWEERTADLRQQLATLERPVYERAAEPAINKFPPDIRPMMRAGADGRGPLEHQLAELAYRQVKEEHANLKMANMLSESDKLRWEELRKQLAEFENLKPRMPWVALTVTDVGRRAPATVIPGDPSGEDIAPGFLSVLDPSPARIEPPPAVSNSTGRRTALARWITSPDNPLAARVLVNRIWQVHFGRGLVGTASDFGSLGDRPSHPELLDWLAAHFVDQGWSIKALHRVIVNSATYRQSALTRSSDAEQKDPSNHWLWRGNIRRLDAEQIRDAMLVVSGELQLDAGGPSSEWLVPRRSVYLKMIRNQHEPLLRAFDGPDGFNSVAHREVTTIPTQALLLINGQWTLARAQALAARLCRSDGLTGDRLVREGYRWTVGREPDPQEFDLALSFLAGDSKHQEEPPDAVFERVVDFCHTLLNANEFVYVD